jgi:hypothetical protein
MIVLQPLPNETANMHSRNTEMVHPGKQISGQCGDVVAVESAEMESVYSKIDAFMSKLTESPCLSTTAKLLR